MDTKAGATRPLGYVASPLGFTEAGRDYYERVYLPALATVVEPVDPWSLITPGEAAEAAEKGLDREMSLEIGRRNIEAIRSSDVVIAYLDGQEPDSGTVAELGFAAGLGKACFGLRSDLREAGEQGSVVSLQVEAFVLESGGAIYRSLLELVAGLEAHLVSWSRVY